MSIKVTYPINYQGYLPLLRRILLLVKDEHLTLQELGFYICLVMQADYDQRHRNYRVIIRDDKQLAQEFGLNKTTIFRYRKKLIQAGLLIEENGLTKVMNFRIFELDWVQKIASIPHLSSKDLFLTPQQDIAEMEASIADLRENQGQKRSKESKFNVSFKGNTSNDDLWLDKNDTEK